MMPFGYIFDGDVYVAGFIWSTFLLAMEIYNASNSDDG